MIVVVDRKPTQDSRRNDPEMRFVQKSLAERGVIVLWIAYPTLGDA